MCWCSMLLGDGGWMARSASAQALFRGITIVAWLSSRMAATIADAFFIPKREDEMRR